MKVTDAEYEKFRHLLRKCRIDAKLTQAEVAKRLEEPQSFVSKYESGERRLDILELAVVSKALDTSLQNILGKLQSRAK